MSGHHEVRMTSSSPVTHASSWSCSVHASIMEAACRKENGWLDLRLHYTGDGDSPQKSGIKGKDSPSGSSSSDAKLSIEQTMQANNKKFPPVERPELKLASPFFLKPRLVSDPPAARWNHACSTFLG